jgi:hypothetical protein
MGYDRASPTAASSQASVTERRLRSRLRVEPAMATLLFTCPKTQQQATTSIDGEVENLRAVWSTSIKVSCPHCGAEHRISVRETFVDGALQDATGRLRQSS